PPTAAERAPPAVTDPAAGEDVDGGGTGGFWGAAALSPVLIHPALPPTATLRSPLASTERGGSAGGGMLAVCGTARSRSRSRPRPIPRSPPTSATARHRWRASPRSPPRR